MKIYTEFSLEDFDAWSGAVDTKNRILDEGKDEEFEAMMDELYPDGMSDTEMNDLLWFEDDWIFEELGIKDEDDEEDEDDDNILDDFCDQYPTDGGCGDCPLKEIEDCEGFVESIYHEDYNVSLESLTKKVIERINK